MIEKELICVNCPMGCRLTVALDGDKVVSVKGNNCPRGKTYAEKECVSPERILTTTVKINSGTHRVLPVITDREIPLGKIFEAMDILKGVSVEAPVSEGQVIVHDILGSGANVVASRSMNRCG